MKINLPVSRLIPLSSGNTFRYLHKEKSTLTLTINQKRNQVLATVLFPFVKILDVVFSCDILSLHEVSIVHPQCCFIIYNNMDLLDAQQRMTFNRYLL